MTGTSRKSHRPSDSDRSARHPEDRDPLDLAPSVDRAWAQEFVLEQRLLDVPGARIGDALVTVQSHVADSGETAQEAFGDARGYARALATAEGATPGPVGPATVTWAVLGLVGMIATGWGFTAWLDGGPADVSVGALVGGAFLLTSLGALLLAPGVVLRALVSRIWVGAVLMAIPVIATVVATLLLPATAFTAPSLPVLALGLLLVAVSSVLGWLDHDGVDLVLAPGERPTGGGRTRVRLALVLPAATLVVLALSWVFHLLA